jgi:inorganic triphosphatase YgiF
VSALRRLRAHRLLRGRGRAVARRLYSVYFDTLDFDLHRQGVALRLRREAGRWLQTAKGGGCARAGLHQRLEFEAEVAGPMPDCSCIPDDAFGGLFAARELRVRLKPVFVTEFRRSSRLLEPAPGVRIEASLDRGQIRAGGRSTELCEIELELKDGPAHHLYDLALRLLDAAPLALEDRSKAERGYALCRDEPLRPQKARPVPIAPEATVEDAFVAVVSSALAHLHANARGMLESRDPEYLHQMRVALRRLRSAFGQFSPLLPAEATAAIVAELKWLAAALGPARDWDVFVTETLPSIRTAFAGDAALAGFARVCARKRYAAARRARRAVGSARYQRLVLSLSAWLAAGAWQARMDEAALARLRASARDFAAAVLDRRSRRVAKRGRGLDALTADELHALRIAVKKLRYAADFFSALFDAEAGRALLARLARLQDILGAMNDAATVERLLRDAFGAEPPPAVAEARGIMLGWSRGRALTLRRELRPAWKAYRAAGKFW